MSLITLLCVNGCAPKLMKLPTGAGVPASDAGDVLADATETCRGVSTISAEVAVAGSVGGRGVRGRLIVGVASPASVRIEAAAPFGPPVFIFVARGNDATLLLPREQRVLEHGAPDAVLEAAAGVPLDAADFRGTLTACPSAPESTTARAFGDDWRTVTIGPDELYLHRDAASAPWQVAATVHKTANGSGWRAEYRDFQNGLPRSVRLISIEPKRFDLRLTLSQVEINTTLGAEVFRVQIPPDASPISLQELRDAGPLRGSSRADTKSRQ